MKEGLFGGVDHVAIAARDPAALAEWYCAVLGFQAVSDSQKERPTRLLAGPGGGMIEMMPDDETPPPSRELYDRGLSHVAIRVSDLATAIESLRSRGIEVAEPLPAAGGGRIANFHDPEANVLQLVERPLGWSR
jgi:glyoxylase I family protein